MPNLRAIYRKALNRALGLTTMSGNIDKPRKPTPMPEGWIVEGKPMCHTAVITESKDGHFRSGVWECTAGTFDWHFFVDEIVHILEGEVIIQDKKQTMHLRAGDVGHFPAGSVSRWTVPKYVRKFFTHREPGKIERQLRGM